MLTHKQVAQLHPRSCYSVAGRMPEWVLFHKFSIASNNATSGHRLRGSRPSCECSGAKELSLRFLLDAHVADGFPYIQYK